MTKVCSGKDRIDIIDAVRGFVIIMMILFHICYDTELVFGVDIPFFTGSFKNVILIIFPTWFFVISGICTAFSHNLLKRGVFLFLVGEVITLVTSIAVPDNLILFGAITSIGVSMILYYFCRKLVSKVPWVLLFTVCLIAFVIFSDFAGARELNFIFVKVPLDLGSANQYLYPFGIVYDGFHSSDYFPLVPYFFAFLSGTALSVPIAQKKLPQWFYTKKIPFLNKMGRYSLIIYIVHQPVILAVFMIIKYFKG